MARTRFVPDTGLTVRMTTVLFLLGGLFVAVVVALMYAFPSYAVIIGLAGIGIAFFQWWNSDKAALRAMRAREVTPEQAPELHGMIDRLCAMADMPKPRVAIADSPVPNAFATGRSPSHSAVCVTTGILQTLTVEELEGVLAHELSHVAHRDVLVMTLAASAGIVAGMVTRGAQFGVLGRRNNDNSGGAIGFFAVLIASLVVYAISFLLLRVLSRYRELAADRAGAYLTQRPAALATALQKVSGQMNAVPERDLRAAQSMNALFIAPAVRGLTLGTLTATHPPLEQRLDQLAEIAANLGQTH
ncbi:MAG: zinc metalloprotease HtpX [Marmoricola sp.]